MKSVAITLVLWSFLIAALIFSAGYYSAPIFFTIQRIWIVLGRCLFYDSKRSIGEVPFLINFIGVIFEAGNETREKIWSDFGAEQKLRAERKESGFCSYRCFWESEKLMCEKILSKRANFFCSRAAFKSSFFCNFWWLWGLIMILLIALKRSL